MIDILKEAGFKVVCIETNDTSIHDEKALEMVIENEFISIFAKNSYKNRDGLVFWAEHILAKPGDSNEKLNKIAKDLEIFFSHAYGLEYPEVRWRNYYHDGKIARIEYYIVEDEEAYESGIDIDDTYHDIYIVRNPDNKLKEAMIQLASEHLLEKMNLKGQGVCYL